MAGAKRKRSHGSANELYSNTSRSRPSVEARLDPTYGQRTALPGLDDDINGDGYDDELNYDDDMDALSYVRAVRQEATAIPNLLVAPKDRTIGDSREIYENGVGDYRGLYEDGAYFSAPQPCSETSDDAGKHEGQEVGRDPQSAYFESILSRYETLREQLQKTPPAEAVEKLESDHPTHVGNLNTEVARWWRWKMRTVNPLPAQIASMDKSTVLRLLGLLTGGSLLKRGTMVQVGVSRWAWGLLARLPERGELTSEEIGVVRELGKKAVLVGMGLRGEKHWEEGMDEVEAVFDEDVEEEIVVINEDATQLHSDDELDDGRPKPQRPPADPINYENSEHLLSKGPQLGTQLYDVSISEGLQEIVVLSSLTDAPTAHSLTTGADFGPGRRDVELPPISSEIHDDDNKVGLPLEEVTAVSEDLAAVRARILQRLNNGNAPVVIQEKDAEIRVEAPLRNMPRDWNTMATVDMIITVAGEVYGQRDLLEFREVWGEVG